MTTIRELMAEKASITDRAREIIDRAQKEDRDLTSREEREYNRLVSEAEGREYEIRRRENGGELKGVDTRNMKAIRLGGNDEERAAAQYIRTGDRSGLRDLHLASDGEFDFEVQIPTIERRATDEIMNVAATADGGAAVPTGFVNQIAARRSEISLASQLGCQLVPGIGTTVNYPYENADPAVFATTAEQVDAYSNTYERDRPTLAAKAFTLVKKTKKIPVTEELMDDEDANLLAFIADHIGRAQALTMNAMLLAEAASVGTSVALGAAAVASAGDPEKLVYHSTIGFYLEDGASCGWVMRPATYGAIVNLTGNSRLYAPQAQGNGRRSLLEYPVYYSNSAAAIGASAKSIYFGNWRFMGYRLDPALRLIRDAVTTDGIVFLKYAFRCVFGQLQAGAIGYGAHPSS